MTTILLVKLLVIATLGGAIGSHWDAWWHVAIGRDTSFIPPHIFTFTSFCSAIVVSMLLLWREDFPSRRALKVYLGLRALGIPAVPFDEFWHRLVGVEDLTSPFVVWSPSHLLFFVPSVIAALIVFRIVGRELRGDPALPVFAFLQLGAVWAGLGNILLGPFSFLGPWRVLGVWGEGLILAGASFIILTATRLYQRQGVALSATFVYLALLSIALPKSAGPNIQIASFPPIPFWAVAIPYLIGAVIVEYGISPTRNSMLRGAIYGGVVGMILYTTALYFGDAKITIHAWQLFILVPLTAAGGALGGVLSRKLHRYLAS
jgi:hypothetical protein